MMSDERFTVQLNEVWTFPAVLGTYTAFLVLPPLLLAVLGPDRPAWQWYVGILAELATVAPTVGAVTARRPEAIYRPLGDTKLAWGLPVAGFGYLAVWATLGRGVPGMFVPLSMVALVGSVLAGFLVVVMAQNRLVQERYGGQPVRMRFTAGPSRRVKRTRGALIVAAVVASLGAFVLGYAWNVGALQYVWQIAIPASAGLYGSTMAEQTVVVTDEALVLSKPAHVRAYPWAAVADCRLTADALVVDWHATRRPATEFDRSDIGDPEAVAQAVTRQLAGR